MSNFNYLLYKEKVQFDGKIITLDEIPTNGGFITVYTYDESLPEYFKSNGNKIVGYASTNPPALSRVFYVDFDDNQAAATDLRNRLIKDKIAFKLYDSGGRSIHFHILREPVVSAPYLPVSDRDWAKSSIPGCDLSLYQHSRVFRLPNTVHDKTGKKKVLIEEHTGSKMYIPLKEVILPTRSKVDGIDYEGIFNSCVVRNCIFGVDNGARNKTFIAAAICLFDLGCTQEWINTFLRACNAQCNPPLSEIEIGNIIKYGIRG